MYKNQFLDNILDLTILLIQFYLISIKIILVIQKYHNIFSCIMFILFITYNFLRILFMYIFSTNDEQIKHLQ